MLASVVCVCTSVCVCPCVCVAVMQGLKFGLITDLDHASKEGKRWHALLKTGTLIEDGHKQFHIRCVCVSVHVIVLACISALGISRFLCVRVPVYVCVCVCMCLCLRVCVCACVRLRVLEREHVVISRAAGGWTR